MLNVGGAPYLRDVRGGDWHWHGDAGAPPHRAANHHPSNTSTIAVGAYNCEGFLSAFNYIEGRLLPLCDILVVSES